MLYLAGISLENRQNSFGVSTIYEDYSNKNLQAAEAALVKPFETGLQRSVRAQLGMSQSIKAG
jgi:hypothetical protein